MTGEEKQLIKKAVACINESVTDDIRIMEICGTHTHQIARFGIRSLITPKIHLVSGPGCPVCVTEAGYIDALIYLLEHEDVVLATFGDLLRVSGSLGSLEEEKALGRKVITVYSPEDVLSYAKKHENERIVFAAVGFETTAPLYAALIKTACIEEIDNLFFLTSLKRMEPAIKYILGDLGVNIDGMLCPGHVAAVTGIAPFIPIIDEYKIPAVICGFEALDIIGSINILCSQITGKSPICFINTYKRCVSDSGNISALKLIDEVFEISSVNWRKIGVIENSAYSIKAKYSKFDAIKKFNIEINHSADMLSDECECGKVMIGEKTPNMCKNFGGQCTPDHPIGPCMISSEGACAAYYRYGGGKI